MPISCVYSISPRVAITVIGDDILSVILTLEVSALSSSLSLEESHTIRVHFYGDQEGTIPTLELYLEVFLAEEYCIDHFVILDHTPFILEAELYLYFTLDRRLAE